jgi:Asp-tRNA(Asn)/Glu-tRNA(Gln) amidotransferase A subunit family amidase
MTAMTDRGYRSARDLVAAMVAFPHQVDDDPVGMTGDGRPVGVQVAADFLHDRTALAAAARIGEVLGGFTPPPGYDGPAS